MPWLLTPTRYVDRMEKRNGEWRIADRVVVYDSERTHQVTAGESPLTTWNFGRRDKDDFSYAYGLVG